VAGDGVALAYGPPSCLAGRRSRRNGGLECAIVRGILLAQSEVPPRQLYVMNVTKLALQIALFTEVTHGPCRATPKP
jgi:hypothetical protein